nr:glutathione S-transferase family protein [Methylomonas lenta]
MKFYFTPGACSIGIHILLEELELIFEAYVIDLLAGDQHKPEFLAINPKASIPTLVRDDNTALTEFQAIAYWLARSHPKADLLPGDADGDTRAIELMDFVVGTLHGQGFMRIFVPEKFVPNTMDYDFTQQQGREIVQNGLTIVNQQLPTTGYAFDNFSIADAALFYVEFWADKAGIELPVKCRQHYQLMLIRPAVRRVLMEEGYRVNANV